jgi:flagellar biosynthesis/type III secretory pathway M-ring protein FliF/YscJ
MTDSKNYNTDQLIAYLVIVCLSIVVSLVATVYFRNSAMNTHFKEEIKLRTYNYLKAEDFKN